MKIDPPASEWPDLIARRLERRDEGRARRFREQVGLPVEQPVVMTGHQPSFWHPGVLAKFLACDIASSLMGAACAWIIPDQDEVDPFGLRAPVEDARGRLRAGVVRLAERPPTGAPACSSPAQRATAPKTDGMPLESVREGAQRIAAALDSRAGEPDAARQAMAAGRDLLSDLLTPAPMIFASDLHRTDLFGEMLDRMARDPDAMIEPYNAVADALPQAGVARLIHNPARDRRELPLWRVRMGEPRRRVYAHELDRVPREELAPRALLMTALVRLAGCELFIHGTGGEAYDAVTERWIGDWLGEALAPMAMVTTTLRLPLRNEVPTPERVAASEWRAHHARHDPSALGDTAAAKRKREALARIDSLRERGEDPAPAFQEMQRDLRQYREAHRQRLDALREEAQSMRRRLGEREVVEDRTWAFPLHEPDALRALRDEIAIAFSGVGVPSG